MTLVPRKTAFLAVQSVILFEPSEQHVSSNNIYYCISEIFSNSFKNLKPT